MWLCAGAHKVLDEFEHRHILVPRLVSWWWPDATNRAESERNSGPWRTNDLQHLTVRNLHHVMREPHNRSRGPLDGYGPRGGGNHLREYVQKASRVCSRNPGIWCTNPRMHEVCIGIPEMSPIEASHLMIHLGQKGQGPDIDKTRKWCEILLIVYSVL